MSDSNISSHSSHSVGQMFTTLYMYSYIPVFMSFFLLILITTEIISEDPMKQLDEFSYCQEDTPPLMSVLSPPVKCTYKGI